MQFTFNVTGGRAGDYKGKETDSPRVTLQKVANYIQGLSGASYVADSFTVSTASASAELTFSGVGGTSASGSVALSGVGGTAASGTVTLGGGAGNVTIVVGGTSVGPVAFNVTDAQTATDCITALNANVTVAALVTATSGGSGVVLITADAKGTAGNAVTLTASRTLGTATASGATLTSGVQGSVGVTVNGTLVTTDTTNLADGAAATAIAIALDADATLGPLLNAEGDGTDVNIEWVAKGSAGNAITLTSTSATGTATASGATLANGAQGSVTIDVGAGPDATETTDTTNLTDSAAAALIASEINANGTFVFYALASSSGDVLTLTATQGGPAANTLAFAAATDTGTALPASGTLAGGDQFTYNL
jgi:hypothetical protein